MSKLNLIIYDTDIVYIKNLINYLEKNLPLPISIKAYTDKEKFISYVKSPIDLIIIADLSAVNQLLQIDGLRNVFILSCDFLKQYGNFTTLYRLQKIKDLVDVFLKGLRGIDINKIEAVDTKLYGITSPSSVYSQEIISKNALHYLSEKGKTIYLKLRVDFGRIKEQESISNAIYELLDYSGDENEVISKYFKPKENYFYIPAINNINDLWIIKIKHIDMLIKQIERFGFNYALIDFDYNIPIYRELFDLCNFIIMTRESGNNINKEYMKMLIDRNDNTMEKTIFCSINDNVYERLKSYG